MLNIMRLLLSCLICLFLGIQGKAESTISLYTKQQRQVIDGFGAAQAGWAAELYQHHKREKIMNLLFGKNGLRLSILRGEVFPLWATDTTDDHLKRRAQLWITQYAKKVCNVEKLIFSIWSPPAYMKSNGKVSHGYLKPDYYQDFADYLVAFCNAYREAGLNIYAISPSNEPGYEAPWNSCRWTPEQMGLFLNRYLEPTLRTTYPNMKIIYGENPCWSDPEYEKLLYLSSYKFVNTILDNYPTMNDTFIAAGHGYEIPLSQYIPGEKDVEVPIIPYKKAQEKKQHVWMTEMSSIDSLDVSMKNGLKWASIFHHYLVDGEVNAFIWWAGAMPTANNESLIILNKNNEDYSLTRRYATLGNYSRYIPVGSRRIINNLKGFPKGIEVSSFCYGKQYSVVIVNPSNRLVKCNLKVNDAQSKGLLKQYLTTNEDTWKETQIQPAKKGYILNLKPESVTTLVGTIQ